MTTVIIHGGAGSALEGTTRAERLRSALDSILDELWELAVDGASAMELVERGCVALEDCEHFNAGTGSKLQRDGVIRMSAAIMDGSRRRFSGVINVEDVKNPIEMARALQKEPERVLDTRGGHRLARSMGLEVFDPLVTRRFDRWLDKTKTERLAREDGESDAVASGEPPREREDEKLGTVGVVVRDARGELAASTSTGGRGFERAGRVSDTPTVAGNYATDRAAVSCTGNGEDIVDEALAARIVVAAEHGRTLEEAVTAAMDAAADRQRRVGAICVDDQGAICFGKTTEVLLAVGRTEETTEWAF